MDDPWDSPWATEEPSTAITPTILAPNNHGPNEGQDEGFSSPKQNEWESSEWSSEPWTRNTDSAISLGENNSKLDGDEDVWTKRDENEFKKRDEDQWGSRTQHAVTGLRLIVGDAWDKKEDDENTNNTVQDTDGWPMNESEPKSADGNVSSPNDTLDVKTYSGKRLSKVQELVTMYNDMAAIGPSSDLGKPAEESPEDASVRDGTAAIPSDSEEEQAGSSHLESKPIAEVSVETQKTDSDGDIEEEQERGTPGPEAQSEPAPELIEPKHNGLAYPINLSRLDELLPSTRPIPRPDISIPDTLPADSFTSISQRKSWYRMSRYGSSRMHDTGEGYTRVTWPNSQVRTKTIQIVRRWMEQDSIAGRVVLGGKAGGAIGASLFNWDSNEPAVQIGDLLKERKRRDLDAVHTRVHSAPTQEPTEKAAQLAASVPATPAAGMFDRVAIPKSPWEEDTSQPPTPLFNTYETNITESTKPSPIMPPTPFVVAKTQATDENRDDNDEDDDWGEMVTSPAAPESGTFSSMIPSDQQQESKDENETLDIQVSQHEPEADDWDFGGWASPSVEKTPIPTSDAPKIVSSPVMQPMAPAVASHVTDDGGWGFGDMSFFDSGPNAAISPVSVANEVSKPPLTPPANQALHKDETLQREEVNNDAVASALRSLPNLTYMLN